MDALIGPARDSDRAGIVDLLEAADLPTAGLDRCWAHALVARLDGRLVGCAALEVHGPDAVLRSVAVAAQAQGSGVGVGLVEASLDLARRSRVEMLYLLTETASAFFPRFGFEPCAREGVPAAIGNSIEFASLCPSSAVAMCLRL